MQEHVVITSLKSAEDLSKPILFERTKITRYKLCDFCFVHLSIVLEQLLSNWFLKTWHKWGKWLC